TQTYYEDVEKNGTITSVRKLGYKGSMNVLGLITFCIVFGILLSRMGRQGQVMIDFFSVLTELTMQMVDLVMWYSPIGIMSLICAKILAMDDPDRIFAQLAMYMVTVILGLIIHLGVLMLIYFALTRQNPIIFFQGMLQAWLTAIATSSSLKCYPTSLYMAVSFNDPHPQCQAIHLPPLEHLGSPPSDRYSGQYRCGQRTQRRPHHHADGPDRCRLSREDVSLLLTVDWFLDRCRTSINVLGDSYGAAIVQKFSQKELDAATERVNTFNPQISDKFLVQSG
ncbi:putative excitatory amino acid transporter, partial [Apostichopus japonicus]